MSCSIIVVLLLYATMVTSWSIDLKNESVTVQMHKQVSLPFSIDASDLSNFTLQATSDESIATVKVGVIKQVGSDWYGNLNITGIFLGHSKISLTVYESKINQGTNDVIVVTVLREERTVDRIFTASVVILVSLLYINFGCAVDWELCRRTLKRPVGPAIGSFCQFLVMPLLSYVLGHILFPDRPDLQIGLFFTGISPSGGASNIWTLLLDGNLNVSITMTTIFTLLAFGTMPFWVFTLGTRIFERSEIKVPYVRMASLAVGLIIPLAIGFFVQKKLPRLSKILVRIMRPLSVILIIFIVVFAIYTNLYLFKLFSKEIVIAGMGLPWIGFIIGLIAAWSFKQPWSDVKAIAIETGIQNTGISIFLLRFTLEPPADDLTTVVPVSAAIMTPIPLAILYMAKMAYNRRRKSATVTELSLQDPKEVTDIALTESY